MNFRRTVILAVTRIRESIAQNDGNGFVVNFLDRTLAALAMRDRNTCLPAIGCSGGLRGNQLARPVVSADLLHRKCLVAGAAFHSLYPRPMKPGHVTHLDVRGFSSQGIGLSIVLTLNLEAILITENTALQGVMSMMNLNQHDRADHHSASPDCSCGDLGPGRTEAYVVVI